MNWLGFFLLKPLYSIDIILNMTLENKKKNKFILIKIRKYMTVTYDWSNINFKKVS